MTGAGRFRLCLLLAWVTALACGDDFPVYSELEGLRVLAVRADPPAVGPGQVTELSALVFDGDGEPDELRYAWSWCPARAPSAAGGECLIDEGELAAQLGLEGLSFDLGEQPTASFTHEIPPEVIGALCSTSAKSDAGQDSGFLLNCDQGLPISVQLIVRRGRETITSTKELRLLLDGQEAESNPTIDGITFKAIDEDVMPDDVTEDGADPLAQDGSSELRLDREYRLFADVPVSASERFIKPPEGFQTKGTDKLENLTVAWFVTSGEVDKERTAFTDGTTELTDIRGNTWSLPKPGDESARAAELYLVIRDERGGTGWLRRQVGLTR